ncbi:MAG: type I-E CRISPR-associated endonuclease Cas1e [Proteobacteria bacterium]|jgi:CRISPR-associated protein Cas1|nr:type I-E CRISPR-associated endonuclease Cas1e [Pseudomonadota bacterium]
MKNLKELPKLRDSLSFVYFEHSKVERAEGAVAVFDKGGETHVPAAALGAIMLGPGTSITHEAIKVLAESGCSVLWVGENGVRLYAQGLGETRSAVRLLRQAALHADPAARLAVVFKMYEKRFAEELPAGITLAQIRGREGVRVRTAYARAAAEHGVVWKGRDYSRDDWGRADPVNRTLSTAASCLYGICHCACAAAGYSTALGFIHTGKMLSFVYDVADLYRVETVVPVAFEIAGRCARAGQTGGMEREVRLACRDAFFRHKVLERVVADIDDLMRVEPADVERAQGCLDAADDPPGALWDPETGEVVGGTNYDPDLA